MTTPPPEPVTPPVPLLWLPPIVTSSSVNEPLREKIAPPTPSPLLAGLPQLQATMLAKPCVAELLQNVLL